MGKFRGKVYPRRLEMLEELRSSVASLLAKACNDVLDDLDSGFVVNRVHDLSDTLIVLDKIIFHFLRKDTPVSDASVEEFIQNFKLVVDDYVNARIDLSVLPGYLRHISCAIFGAPIVIFHQLGDYKDF
jgi:Asp-tRNA(Asn)/Glu-tRNA(Gln) amidotransferase C subunit